MRVCVCMAKQRSIYNLTTQQLSDCAVSTFVAPEKVEFHFIMRSKRDFNIGFLKMPPFIGALILCVCQFILQSSIKCDTILKREKHSHFAHYINFYCEKLLNSNITFRVFMKCINWRAYNGGDSKMK